LILKDEVLDVELFTGIGHIFIKHQTLTIVEIVRNPKAETC